ncbi:MAG: DUF4037 domain-containing protein [Desulfosarcina sp.]|nr:DUF4037 domain-containing protein [Desulfobacterales bacterium]
MNGLELSRKFFNAHGFPMLKHELGHGMDRIAVGLAGDGSECYGFDDKISQDHDWGPGFCIWLLQEDYDVYGQRLQQAYDKLPDIFEGYGPRKTGQWGSKRVGVFEIISFYQTFTGREHIPEDYDEWLMLPENSLAACTNGEIFMDGPGEFTRHRKKLLSFYPDDVRLKKIASRCMTIGQAGQYNFQRLVHRGELFATRYAEVKFIADAISLVFLLNRKYTPFYKWMHRALKNLPILGEKIYAKISSLTIELNFEKKRELIEIISAILINELVRQGLSLSGSSFIMDHGPEVQARIQDRCLRRRNVWVG